MQPSRKRRKTWTRAAAELRLSAASLVPSNSVAEPKQLAKNLTTATPATSRPVESLIRVIRCHKVILDADLAELYQVGTRVLNQAVRRNLDRFPEDFMFQLVVEEADVLRSQIVISNEKRG